MTLQAPAPAAGVLAILADDLTGACDSAVPFARHGLVTRVLLAPRPVEVGPGERVDVVAVDANTRQLSRRVAVPRTVVAARALRTPETSRLFKKVDSTLRGHVGPELRACLRAWDLGLAILCPAFPATGRWVQGGELFVDRRGSLGMVAALAGLPPDSRTGHLGLETLRAGVDAVHEVLVRLAAGGARVVVADADTPGHLTTLVEATTRMTDPVLLAGSGGLASALAGWLAQVREADGGSGRGGSQAGATSAHGPGAADGPPWLVVAGSATEVTHHQVVELERAGAEMVGLDVDELLARPSLALAAGRRAATLLQQDVTPVIRLLVSPRTDGVRSRGTRLDERAARALARAVRVAVERTTPGGLFLTGGSTARACLLALGVSGLRLEQEPLPGIALGAALGGVWDGRPVITKSGGFGAPDAIRRLVRPRSPQRVSLPTAHGAPPVA
ncbi:MAG: four-carbon acid sugar kinase family protein [Chloroflexota bacterium]